MQPVVRTLMVLRVMNEREHWSLHELAERTSLPKSSVHRLLRVLEENHYVVGLKGRYGAYRLTRCTRELSAGVSRYVSWADLAEPLIIDGTRALRWPLSFGMFDQPFMRIVSCGMPYSPFAAKPTSLGRRHWPFSSALGMAYLAFSSPEQVEAARCAAASYDIDPTENLIPTKDELAKRCDDIRRRGYAVRAARKGDWNAAFAVPIGGGGQALYGALVCSVFPHTLTDDFVSPLLPAINDIASQIAEKIRRET